MFIATFYVPGLQDVALVRSPVASARLRQLLAYWGHRLDELVVYLSTQGGQMKRLALSQMLGLPEKYGSRNRSRRG
jgi:carbon-monoxide dehydrogenase large subunit